MDEYLKSWNSRNLNQEASDSLNVTHIYKEIENVVVKIPTKKSSGPGGFMAEFYKALKGDVHPLFFKLLRRIQAKGNLPISFY